jgi:septation ring formation regulator EzrA
MSFFESDIVINDLNEIEDLQKKAYQNAYKFSFMDKDEKLEHIDTLMTLIEKQKLLYVRLSLSEDPEAKHLQKRIEESVVMMGMSEDGSDIYSAFDAMTATVKSLKEDMDRA